MYARISRSDLAAAAPAPGAITPAPADNPETSRLPRGRGRAELVFEQRNGRTVTARAYQAGTAKLRFPNVPAGDAPETVLINLGGGLTGGDRLEVAARTGEGASAILTTQACEKIYRSLGENAVIRFDLEAEAGSRLEWLGQPTIMFNRGRLHRETHVNLADGATFLGIEGVIFGRTAMGEVVTEGALSDAWFIRRGGKLIHAERFAVSGAIAEELAKAAVLGENCAMATLRYVAADAESRLDEMRQLLETTDIAAAASAWNGMLLVRFAALGGFELTRELVRVVAAFRGAPMPRAWIL